MKTLPKGSKVQIHPSAGQKANDQIGEKATELSLRSCEAQEKLRPVSPKVGLTLDALNEAVFFGSEWTFGARGDL